MRYFTPAWHRGDLTDEEFEAVPERYAIAVATMCETAPEAIAKLVAGPSLHDALVISASVDRRRRQVTLRLRAGDLQRGYFDREMVYDGVRIEHLDTDTFARIARDPSSELLYDEVDREVLGPWTHRLLFWPDYRELELVFDAIRFSDRPQGDRTVPLAKDRYSESVTPAV